MPFPEDLSLIELNDISFLNMEAEAEDIKVERDFYASNPGLGTFTLWPLQGSQENPNDMDEE